MVCGVGYYCFDDGWPRFVLIFAALQFISLSSPQASPSVTCRDGGEVELRRVTRTQRAAAPRPNKQKTDAQTHRGTDSPTDRHRHTDTQTHTDTHARKQTQTQSSETAAGAHTHPKQL
jgi:hypothetical protein